MYMDDTHGKIGFWTDNGGFYHYAVGSNQSLGDTYVEESCVTQHHITPGIYPL